VFHLIWREAFSCGEGHSVSRFSRDYVDVNMWDDLVSGLSVVDGDV